MKNLSKRIYRFINGCRRKSTLNTNGVLRLSWYLREALRRVWFTISSLKQQLLIIFLFSWAILATYCLTNNIDISKFFGEKFRIAKPQTQEGKSLFNMMEEYQILREFLNNYYTIDGWASKRKKVQSIQGMLSKKEQQKVLSKYQRTLDYFRSENGKQKFTLKKILRDQERGLYICYLAIHQKFQTAREYFVKLELGLSSFGEPHESHYSISHWKEEVLIAPPNELSKKAIYVGHNTMSHIQLPCSATSVASISRSDNVEMKLGLSSKNINFYTSNDFSNPAQFKANCGRRIFKIELVHNQDFLTLYQPLGLLDGIKPPRKLTPSEKLMKAIEDQLGVEVTKVTK